MAPKKKDRKVRFTPDTKVDDGDDSSGTSDSEFGTPSPIPAQKMASPDQTRETVNDASVDDGDSIESDNEAASQLSSSEAEVESKPAVRVSEPKAKKPSIIQGLDLSSIIDAPDIDTCKKPRPSARAESRSPSPAPKRRRMTRGQDKKPLYDAMYHPMDVVLRPQSAATKRFKGAERVDDSRKRESILQYLRPRARDSEDGDEQHNCQASNQQNKTESTSGESTVRQHIFASLQDNSTPETYKFNISFQGPNSQEDPMIWESSLPLRSASGRLIIKEPDHCIGVPQECKELLEDSNLRRSSRTSASETGQPCYDGKLHPMDKILRPKFAAKRTVSQMKPVTLPLPPPAPHRNPKEESPVKKPATPLKPMASKLRVENTPLFSDAPDIAPLASSRLSNPFVSPRQLDWYEIQDIDRRLYLSQQGAPIQGHTLPRDWKDVKDTLFEDGEITRDELVSKEGTLFVKERYENTRLGIEKFFDAKPEITDKSQWTVYQAEQPHVFHGVRGVKYWRHFIDSIVEPHVTKACTIQTAAVGESNKGNDGKAEAVSSGHFMSSDMLPSAVLESGDASFMTNDKTLIGHDDHSELEDTFVEIIQNGAFMSSHTEENDKMMSEYEVEKLFAPVKELLADHGLDDVASMRAKNPANKQTETSTTATRAKNPKARKTEAKRKVDVIIHEDSTDRSPELRRYVALNPASPRTDVPKENMSSPSSSAEQQSSSHHSTPRSQRFRIAANITSSSMVARSSAVNARGYTSLFGGPL